MDPWPIRPAAGPRPPAPRKALAAVALIAALGLGTLAAAPPGPAAAASHAKAPKGWVVTLTGALKGTLRLSPHNCLGAGPTGGQVQLTGRLRGTPHRHWTITYRDPRSGTWGGRTPGVTTFTLETAGPSVWVAHRGSYSTNGTAGSARLTLVPEALTPTAHGTVHLRATWTCPARQ